MRPWLVLALVALASSRFEPAAQQLAPGTGVISGRVVNAITGEPIKGAYVSTFLETRSIGFESPSSVQSNDVGQFFIRAVPPGRIRISASASGFLDGQFGALRPQGIGDTVAMTDGHRLEAVVVRLWPGAAIEGRVVDQTGTGLNGIQVFAYQVVDGRLSTSPPGQAATIANGDYRIVGLPSGRYVVAVPMTRTTLVLEAPSGSCAPPPPPLPPGVRPPPVAPSVLPPPGTLITDGPKMESPGTGPNGRRLTYRSTFAPGDAAPDLLAARRVQAGDVLYGVDILLRPVEAYTVRGRLSGLPAGQRGEVTLSIPAVRERGGRRSDQPEARAYLRADGTFEFRDVPAGRYHLAAQPYSFWDCDVIGITERPWNWGILDVADDLNELTLERNPQVTLGGRVSFHGQAPRPLLDILLIDVDGSSDDTGHGRVEGDTITVGSVRPGRFLLHANDNGALANRNRWWLESASLAGRDILGKPFDVGFADLYSLAIAFTDQPSPVEGAVLGESPEAVAAASVAVFPIDPARRSLQYFSPLMTSVRVAHGRYRIRHLAPGDYFLAAVPEAIMGDWPSPAFLAGLERQATRITVRPRQSLSVDLTLRGSR